MGYTLSNTRAGREPAARRALLLFLLHRLPRLCRGRAGPALAAQRVACTLLLDGLRTRTLVVASMHAVSVHALNMLMSLFCLFLYILQHHVETVSTLR